MAVRGVPFEAKEGDALASLGLLLKQAIELQNNRGMRRKIAIEASEGVVVRARRPPKSPGISRKTRMLVGHPGRSQAAGQWRLGEARLPTPGQLAHINYQPHTMLTKKADELSKRAALVSYAKEAQRHCSWPELEGHGCG